MFSSNARHYHVVYSYFIAMSVKYKDVAENVLSHIHNEARYKFDPLRI